jgi:hypothetical protein
VVLRADDCSRVTTLRATTNDSVHSARLPSLKASVSASVRDQAGGPIGPDNNIRPVQALRKPLSSRADPQLGGPQHSQFE